METKVYRVDGMTCNHCKDRVATHLLRLKNVQGVNINLERNEIAIKGNNVYEDLVKKVVNGLGYSYVGEISETVV